MITVVVLYSFIALAAILHGSGMVSGAPFGAPPEVGLGIFDQIFESSTANVFGKIVVTFIAISTLGVVNGISSITVATFEQSVASNTIFGAKTLRKKFGDFKATIIISTTILLFWALVIYVPALILKSDSIVDGVSNFPTLFFFAIYAIVILLYTLKRKTVDSKKFSKYLYQTFAWIAIVGIFFVVGYQFIYGFFINAILNPGDTTHWGLYVGDGGTVDGSAFPAIAKSQYMTLAQASIVMFTFTAVFFALPALNYLLTKKFEGNNPIRDTQEIINEEQIENTNEEKWTRN